MVKARHRGKNPGEPPSPSMTYFEDRGTVLDAPLEVVWDFMEKDEEFHPKAHATTLRNFESKQLSDVTILLSCEVRNGGRWRKMVARLTTIRPAVRILEELEGPYAGSKTVHIYSPRGTKTATDVLFYMRSSELTPSEIKRDRLRTYASSHAEDVPYLRRFVRKHPAGLGPRS
ncbi:MAG: hypothetical protein L3K15_02945 [Thermoplasmata archaeon]|nr:hypothetical protein [Thermoplasmata archaeon]